MAEASPPLALDPENAAAKEPEKHIIWQGSQKVTPKPGDEVHIHYTGTLENGVVYVPCKMALEALQLMYTDGLGSGSTLHAIGESYSLPKLALVELLKVYKVFER